LLGIEFMLGCEGSQVNESKGTGGVAVRSRRTGTRLRDAWYDAPGDQGFTLVEASFRWTVRGRVEKVSQQTFGVI